MFHPFTHDIPTNRMEQAAFAFICQNQKWIRWPKFRRQFQEFKELYFGRQCWIVRPIEYRELNKIDRENIETRREYAMAHMLLTLQHRQNQSAVLYWEGRVRQLLNHNVNMLHNTFNHGDKTRAEVLAEQNEFKKTTYAVIEDALTDLEYSKEPVPPMLKKYCQLFIKEMKTEELYLLSDDMEENGLLEEADHFRKGIHTWACPVLRRLAGVTSGVMK